MFLQVQIIREGFLEEAAFDADLAKDTALGFPGIEGDRKYIRKFQEPHIVAETSQPGRRLPPL